MKVRVDSRLFAEVYFPRIRKYLETRYYELYWWMFVCTNRFLLSAQDRHWILVKAMRNMIDDEYKHECHLSRPLESTTMTYSPDGKTMDSSMIVRFADTRQYCVPFDQTLLFSFYELVGKKLPDQCTIEIVCSSSDYASEHPIVINNPKDYERTHRKYSTQFDPAWVLSDALANEAYKSRTLIKQYVTLAHVVYLLAKDSPDGGATDTDDAGTFQDDDDEDTQHYFSDHTKTLCNNPVSLTRRTLDEIVNHDGFYVAPKIDGERFLLFVWECDVYLINRTFNTCMHIGHCDEWEIWHDSIFDVEVVFSSVPLENQSSGLQQKIKSICLLDVLCIQSHLMVVDQTFEQRLRELESFYKSLRFKDGWFQLQTYTLLINWIAYQEDRVITDDSPEGYILIDKNSLYRTGYNETLLKWKPSEQNTIDFVIQSTNTLTITDHNDTYYADACFSEEYFGLIGEFYYNHKKKLWVLYRIRSDKKRSNAKWVVDRIIESINDNITLQDLCTHVRKIIQVQNQNQFLLEHSHSHQNTSSMITIGNTNNTNTTRHVKHRSVHLITQ